MVTPRWYQTKAVEDLWAWFESGNTGNPCIELTTGAGKSHIVAMICRDALTRWPGTRVLMLTHVKELIEQNAEKMRQYWPGAPLGVYSAGLKSRELREPITFGSVQSLRDKAMAIGHISIVIVDEAHIINHKDEGAYRKLLTDLKDQNPHIRVVGLTATPYRMGHGMITDEPAIFSDIIKPATIHDLLSEGHVVPLRSKLTTRLSIDGVSVRGGDYVASELQAAVDTSDQNKMVASEMASWAEREGNRKHWLAFCTGVEHSEHLAEEIRNLGVSCEALHSKLPSTSRDRIIRAYKSGEIKALTNPAMLTTGFDFPNIDLVALVRPTLSVNLYCQIVGRGMRPKDHISDCLVLDFAGAVGRHGPITDIKPPQKGGKGKGDAPVKSCQACHELVSISSRVCPACGEPFPEPEKKSIARHDDDIMGVRGNESDVESWRWITHTAQSGRRMLRVRYYPTQGHTPVDEYLTVTHDGLAGERAKRTLTQIITACGALVSADSVTDENLDAIAQTMSASPPPSVVEYKRDGKFFRVLRRAWLDAGQIRMIG